MHSSLNYSCYDGKGLENDTVTTTFWRSRGTSDEGSAIATAVVSLLLSSVGIPSNLLIMVSIIWQKLYKEPTYIFLLNLAIVDFLLCAVSMPVIVVVGFNGSFIGSTDIEKCHFCQIEVVAIVLLINLTVHFLTAISVDRFIFMKWALKYSGIVSAKCCALTCCGLWLYSLFVAILPLLGFGDVVYKHELSACILNHVGKTSVARTVYYPLLLVLQGAVSLTVSFTTNIWIFCIALKQMKNARYWRSYFQNDKDIECEIHGKLSNSNNMKQVRLFKVFGVIWLTNLITWFPYIIFVINTLLVKKWITANSFEAFSFLSVMLSSVLFPIIEASFIPELRRILVSFLMKTLCCKNTTRRTDFSPERKSRLSKFCNFVCASFLPRVEE